MASSISLFVFAAVQPFVGRLVDSYGVKTTVLLGTGLMAVGFLLFPTVSTLGHLYLYYGVMAGIGFGASSQFVALFRDSTSDRRLDQAVDAYPRRDRCNRCMSL